MRNKINASNDSRYEITQPPRTAYPVSGTPCSGIETCSGCSQLGVVDSPQNNDKRPWWFWLAVGGGVGLVLGAAHRSGMLSNPEKKSESQKNQEAAAIAVQSGISTILWGAPGIGKTAWLKALGEVMRAKVFVVLGSTKEPNDIAGMMTLKGSLIPPIWAKEIRDRSLEGKRSVLFLDEFSSAMPMVHAALLRVVQNKIAGDCDFDPKRKPDGSPTRFKGNAVHVVCAANPTGQGASARDLPPPAANRMLHIDWMEPDVIAYGLGLILGWPKPRLPALPEDGSWKKSEEMNSAKRDITAFVQVFENHLSSFPSNFAQKGRAWPSPRSWEMATEVLGAARFVGASKDIQEILVKGCVGLEAATDFFVWVDERGLPSAEEILKDPQSWLPEENRTDALWRVNNSVAFAVAAKPTVQRWLAACDYIGHVIKEAGYADHMILLVEELNRIRASETGKGNKEFESVVVPTEVIRLFKTVLTESKRHDPVLSAKLKGKVRTAS